MRSYSVSSFLLLPALLRSALATTNSSIACNNSPLLCDKAYSNISHLGAHDSPFLRDPGTSYSTSGDQSYNSTVQLSAGVRLLTSQVHSTNSSGTAEWHLCHTSCDLLDAGLLSDWLSEIKTWLDSNPNEVVTILLVNSDDATASELAAEYAAADIESYAYVPESSTTAPSTWPTLQTLINNGTRLLNFVASLDSSNDTSTAYLMDEFTFIFENNYDNTSPSDFSCTANRPSSVDGDTSAALNDNLMPLMNHFLYEVQLLDIETPNITYINTTNSPSNEEGSLSAAAKECTSEYGRAPQYLLVDFFNVGPAIDTVDSLNGVTDPVGRTTVSDVVLTSSTSNASGRSFPLITLCSSLLIATLLVACS
ncbi:PLC-like phosphodiesterase [Delphinella strobiligena]|nr:PLC-like phosphodiesterase [Delphinella strobiligena]